VRVSVTVATPSTWDGPAGFQATVLDSNEQPIGELLITDTLRTQLITDTNGRQYVTHTADGTTDAGVCANCVDWHFRWVRTDPALTWGVVYAAGVVGSGDGTPAHDTTETSTHSFGLYAEPTCIVWITGDANLSGSVTSSDLILLVHYIFKRGDEPAPCPAAGDVNCNGAITVADVIYLVNFLFKTGPPPCDVCPLIEGGTWECQP
jgi:hypothetical protein